MKEGIISVVVGTAGHIDHGKSSLVRRLTGIDPDRLKEEQATGMTIDLGFAPFDLPDGRRVGLIDVPGHERFVKNMVAGATGIDLVILVVACDDGVMPQTREHLEILTILGVEAGIVALTKIDLPGVDADLVELLELEIEELVEGTFLHSAPICAFDSLSGRGFDAFRDTLLERIQVRAEAKEDRGGGAYRQPIQRVFSARGFGTVVTGVPLAGTLSVGDTVEVITATQVHKGRVRGLQAYGQAVETVRAGHSAAVNVADVDFKTVSRGDTIAAPGVFRAQSMFEARLELLPTQDKPLPQRQTVRVHVGTAEVLGEVILLDTAALNPGSSCLCQLRLRQPLVGAAGDRFVIRRHSPMETLGGGVILSPSRWRLKPFKGFVLQRLAEEESALGDAGRALALQLDQQGEPAKVADVVRSTQRTKPEVEALLVELLDRQAVIEVSGGKGQSLYLSAAGFARACDAITDALEDFHSGHPYRDACPRLQIRSTTRHKDGLLGTCLRHLGQAEEITERPGGFARAGFEVDLGEEGAEFAAALVARFEEEALTPPTREQVLDELRPESFSSDDAADLLRTLVERADLVGLGEDLVLHPTHYSAAQERLRELAQAGPFTASAYREAIGSTRRYVIPLLEHFDALGITKREGNVRVLREEGG